MCSGHEDNIFNGIVLPEAPHSPVFKETLMVAGPVAKTELFDKESSVRTRKS